MTNWRSNVPAGLTHSKVNSYHLRCRLIIFTEHFTIYSAYQRWTMVPQYIHQQIIWPQCYAMDRVEFFKVRVGVSYISSWQFTHYLELWCCFLTVSALIDAKTSPYISVSRNFEISLGKPPTKKSLFLQANNFLRYLDIHVPSLLHYLLPAVSGTLVFISCICWHFSQLLTKIHNTEYSYSFIPQNDNQVSRLL